MTLKERIENNLTLVILGFLAVGFSAGFASFKALTEISGPNRSSISSASDTSWLQDARKADWIPKSDCPAYPVLVNITSPGAGSLVPISRGGYVHVKLVIQASRPLPKTSAVGLISNEENSPNYELDFPVLHADDVHQIFSEDIFKEALSLCVR